MSKEDMWTTFTDLADSAHESAERNDSKNES
jgi:hypothetical protein